MKVFLTGATGFIGSYVAKALLERGDSIVAFVRNPDKVPSLAKNPQVKMVKGELTDIHLFRGALAGCDACVHLALGWGDTPEEMLRKDTLPSVALLEAASDAGCKRFIYTSSTAAMGEMRESMHEELRCIPVDLYGATKSATESYILGFRKTAMRCNVIRPGYTFGNPAFSDSNCQPDGRFRDIATRAICNEPIELIKHDGTQFIFAGDLAKLYLAVLDSDVNREVFLGLAENWVSWEMIAQRTKEGCASSSPVILKDMGWGAEPIKFDVSKIFRQFRFQFQGWPALQEHIDWNLKQAREFIEESK